MAPGISLWENYSENNFCIKMKSLLSCILTSFQSYLASGGRLPTRRPGSAADEWRADGASYSLQLPANGDLSALHRLAVEYFEGHPIDYTFGGLETRADASVKIMRKTPGDSSFNNVARAYFMDGGFVYSRTADAQTAFNANCTEQEKFESQVKGYFGIPFSQFQDFFQKPGLAAGHKNAIRSLLQKK